MDQSWCLYCMSHLVDGVCPNHCPPVLSNEPHMLQPGTLLNGRYLVGRSLGHGGFGITYIGRDTLLNIPVAVKEFFPTGIATRDIAQTTEIHVTGTQNRESLQKEVEKFLNEARTLAQFLDEPGIVTVRDFFSGNGTAYLVTEYIKGETLRVYQTRVGKIPLNELLVLLAPVFRSLTRVHEAGLIHRDISPDNIMITPDGRAKLLDFGTVRSASLAGEHSMSVILKPGYAPEEQYRRRGEQGAWTDVYGLAATIYRCITGITPDDAFQRLYEDELKAPSQLGIPISEAQEAALMKGLAIRHEDRYASVQEFVSALSGKDGEGHEVTLNFFGQSGAVERVETDNSPEEKAEKKPEAKPEEKSEDKPEGKRQEEPKVVKDVAREEKAGNGGTSVLHGAADIAKGKKSVAGEPEQGAAQKQKIQLEKAGKTDPAGKPQKPEAKEKGKSQTGSVLYPGGKRRSGKQKIITLLQVFFILSCVNGYVPTPSDWVMAGVGLLISLFLTWSIHKHWLAKIVLTLQTILIFGFVSKDSIVFMSVTEYIMSEYDSRSLAGDFVSWIALGLAVLTLILIWTTKRDTVVLKNKIISPEKAARWSRMKHLAYIKLRNCRLQDLQVFQNIPHLVSLTLSACGITDISPLSSITGLKILDISKNQIKDAAPLSNLTGLEKLNISGNQIEDITPISGLTALIELDIGNNKIADVRPICGLPKLYILNVYGNLYQDLTPLAELKSLHSLWVNAEQRMFLGPVAENPNVKVYNASKY